MSKRQCTAKRARRKQQQHLYLVVDDWERGYSVRKIDVDAFDSDSDLKLDAAAQPLPDPPVVRFEGQPARLSNFGAYGTKILAMASSNGTAAFPVFDIDTLGLTLCTYPDRHIKPLFVPVAGRLYMLVEDSLAVLGDPPNPDDIHGPKPWSWTRSPKELPFKYAKLVTSYAVHPDGRTLFVSAEERTFSLDTGSLEWTRHGKWAMPFTGQAYFDDELEAWVGLCRHDHAGYLCSCDVPAAGTPARTLPAWKLGKDRLFCADKRRHLGATLLYMGNSSYCLIQSLARRDHQDLDKYPGERVLYVTTFGLKYDRDGELRTTRRRARSYEMRDAHHQLNEPCFNPVAFWM